MRLDALELVHGGGSEIGLAATGTRPQRDILDNQKIWTRAEASGYVLQLNLAAPAVRAQALS